MSSPSNDVIDYRSHIVYVIPQEPNSMKAIEMAIQSTTIHIQNVKEIPPNNRPTWLDGVPMVVNMRTKLAYRGSAALEELKLAVANATMLKSPGIAEPMLSQAGEIAYTNISTSGNTGLTHVGSVVPTAMNEDRYQGGGRIQEDELNRYRSMREKVPPPLPTKDVNF